MAEASGLTHTAEAPDTGPTSVDTSSAQGLGARQEASMKLSMGMASIL